MQLKTLGNTINALQNIESVLNKFETIPKILKWSENLNNELVEATKGYSTEVLKLAASQTTLTQEQATAIFTAKGLKGAELEQAVANATLASSQAATTDTTFALGTAFQGLTFKLKGLIAETISFLQTNPVGWCIDAVLIIGGLAVAFDALTVSIEEAKEKNSELISEFNSKLETIKSNKESMAELASEYKELSSGVDSLGKNISLSSDEYTRYNEIVNKIADVSPNLVQGFTNEGNAILKIRDNVDELTSSYEESTKAAYMSMITSGKTNGYINDIVRNANIVLNGSVASGVSDLEKLKFLEALLNHSSEGKDLLNFFDDYTKGRRYADIYESLFRDATGGYYRDLDAWQLFEANDNELSAIRQSIKSYINTYQSEVDSAVSNIRTMGNAILVAETDYDKLDESGKTIASILVNSINEGIIQQNDLKDTKSLENYIFSLVNSISENKEIQNTAEALFELDLNELSLEESKKKITDYINILADYLNEDSNELKIRLGFSDVDNLYDNLFTVTSNAAKKFSGVGSINSNVDHQNYSLEFNELNSFVKENSVNTQDEIAFWNQCIEESNTREEAMKRYLNESSDIHSQTTDIIFPLSDIKNAYSDFEDILDEIESGATVSASSIDSLTEKFGELNDGESLAKFKEVLTTMPDDMDACKEALNQLATEYLDQSDLLQNLTADNAEYTESELEKLGVANAHEVVQSRLIQLDYSEADAMDVLANCSSQLTDAKDKEKAASIDWANATADEIAWLINEGNAANIDTAALQSYLRQKIQANNITLTTNGDIENLITFCSALGSSTKYMQQYAEAKQKLSLGQSLTGYWKGDDDYLYQLELGAKRELERALSNSTNVNYTPTLPSLGSGSGGSSSQAKDTVKQYNWIETAINRVKDAISRLTKVRDNTYANWSRRNTALNSEIAGITEQIRLQQQAYSSYMAKADSVGLSQDYIRKIQSGAIQVEDITDEGLQDKIDRYQDWYGQALECSDAIEELNINLSGLAQQKFDSLRTEFDSLISTFTAQADMIEERISRTEEQGYFADKTYYEQLIAYENRELAGLRQEYAALQASFREAVDTGRIEEGSEAWHKMRSEILDVEQSMEESTTALVEFHNEIRDLSWDVFDYIADRIGQITQESEFLLDLLERGDLYEDTGAFTSEGMAAAALHGVNYNTYLQQSLDYAGELKRIEADLANDPGNKDLIERRETLLKLQQDAIAGAEAEKDAIQSLVEDGMKLHLDALSRLIDQYKKGLSAARDLYDYQKNISEQTENIAGLEKIMLAYQGDDSEEARKLLQDTRNRLKDARQELQETQWDRYISEAEDLLDTLYDEYETILNQRLDNIDALIADMIDMVNAGSTDIREAIEAAAFRAGYDISSTMQTIFGSGGSQTTLLSTFMNRFETASTTLQNAVNDIRNSIQTRMTAPAGGDGAVTTGGMGNTESSSGPAVINSGTNPSGSPAPQASSPQGDGTAGVGDMVTFVSGRYHEDSWGNGRSGSQCLNGQVYITKIKPDSPYPYHISRGASLGNGDLGWVKLEQLSGYQSGSRRIHGDQWAWTQEDGEELIRSSSGALLTPLSDGDTVFTNEMTRRLWELANGTIPITGLDIHTMAHMPELHENPQVVNNSNEITITLPNATNYAEFKQELQKDNRFIGFVQEVTSGQALGKPKLNRRNY